MRWIAIALLTLATCSAHAAEVAERVLALVNQFRAETGAVSLKSEPRLTSAAQQFAEYLGTTGKFEHDADGTTPRVRARQRGYDACVVGENIAYEYSSRGRSSKAGNNPSGTARTWNSGRSPRPESASPARVTAVTWPCRCSGSRG